MKRKTAVLLADKRNKMVVAAVVIVAALIIQTAVLPGRYAAVNKVKGRLTSLKGEIEKLIVSPETIKKLNEATDKADRELDNMVGYPLGGIGATALFHKLSSCAEPFGLSYVVGRLDPGATLSLKEEVTIAVEKAVSNGKSKPVKRRRRKGGGATEKKVTVPYSVMPVNISVNTTLNSLIGLLHVVERVKKAVSVSRLQVKSRKGHGRLDVSMMFRAVTNMDFGEEITEETPQPVSSGFSIDNDEMDGYLQTIGRNIFMSAVRQDEPITLVKQDELLPGAEPLPTAPRGPAASTKVDDLRRSLKLYGVMKKGGTWWALINSSLVGEGELIEGAKVSVIGPNSVTLQVNDRKFTLEVEE